MVKTSLTLIFSHHVQQIVQNILIVMVVIGIATELIVKGNKIVIIFNLVLLVMKGFKMEGQEVDHHVSEIIVICVIRSLLIVHFIGIRMMKKGT